MDIDKEIRKAKSELKQKAKDQGLWENFGQKKVRELKRKYDYKPYGNNPETKKIDQFENWCMEYTPLEGSL